MNSSNRTTVCYFLLFFGPKGNLTSGLASLRIYQNEYYRKLSASVLRIHESRNSRNNGWCLKACRELQRLLNAVSEGVSFSFSTIFAVLSNRDYYRPARKSNRYLRSLRKVALSRDKRSNDVCSNHKPNRPTSGCFL